jgi:hypothetical protein
LLECYVLDAIGQLHEEHRQALERMVPKLSKTFGKSGTWLEIIAAEMEFPASLPEKIRKNWEGFLAAAYKQGAAVDPEEYAQRFVDANFPDIESAR